MSVALGKQIGEILSENVTYYFNLNKAMSFGDEASKNIYSG